MIYTYIFIYVYKSLLTLTGALVVSIWIEGAVNTLGRKVVISFI